jgi:hypothetical protein
VLDRAEWRKRLPEIETRNHDTVAVVMRSLDEEVLLSSDTGILTFLDNVDRHPYRLVLRRDHIDGIVTIADLQKLPVRTLLFLLVAHVELLLAKTIRQMVGSDEDWLSTLDPQRRDYYVEVSWQSLSKANMAVDRLTATQFADKKEALVQLVTFRDLSRNQARQQLTKVQNMRDYLVHAVEYAHDRASALKAARLARQCR